MVVHNPSYAEGIADSLKTGVAALPAAIDGVLILLGDMPQVTSRTLDRLIARFALDRPDAIVPTQGGRPGNPVLIGRALFPRLFDLTGDTGARNVLQDPRHRIVECAVDDPGVLVDVDTPEMLAALDRAMRH